MGSGLPDFSGKYYFGISKQEYNACSMMLVDEGY